LVSVGDDTNPVSESDIGILLLVAEAPLPDQPAVAVATKRLRQQKN
jgi:hypothetical protein